MATMTDAHTHILPGIDDGAADVAQSLEMLRIEREQGVDTVLLTPHFYRDEETIDSFLARRQAAYEALLEAIGDEPMPKLVLGAEVFLYPGVAKEEGLERLCIEGTDLLLLELPYAPWTERIFEEIDAVSVHRGLTPLIAHVDRYMSFQRNGQIQTLQKMGYPIQLNASGFRKILRRGKLLPILRNNKCCIGSDCHHADFRKPCVDVAAKYLKRFPKLQYALHWKPEQS